MDLLRDAPCAFFHWTVRVRACAGVRTQVAQWGVRRRFRDFVTLADVLSDSHRGYYIPQRPEKTLMEGQLSADKEFVEDRRVQLERYLSALAAHPVRPTQPSERTAKTCGNVGCPFVCLLAGGRHGALQVLPGRYFGAASFTEIGWQAAHVQSCFP